ncbi:hypothetical protein, partial [Azospirillum sp. B4]|uniref:hypothetical protein n=1 Tax=Azospirillum sp. B4 TaxID=95605 RepID=UPI001B3B8A1B
FAPSAAHGGVRWRGASPFPKSFHYPKGLHGGHDTVPFYSLMVEGDALVASGIDGLYRITADGKAQQTPLPELKNIDGAWVSFDLPHVVLVGTVQRLSVGPDVPMMVPK